MLLLGLVPVVAVELPLLSTTDRLHDILSRQLRVFGIMGLVVEAAAVVLAVVGGAQLGLHPAWVVLAPAVFVVSAGVGRWRASRWSAHARRRAVPSPPDIDRAWVRERIRLAAVVGLISLGVLAIAAVLLVISAPGRPLLERAMLFGAALQFAALAPAFVLLTTQLTLNPSASAAVPTDIGERRIAGRALRRGDVGGLDPELRDATIRMARVSAITAPLTLGAVALMVGGQSGWAILRVVDAPDDAMQIAFMVLEIAALAFLAIRWPITMRRVRRVAALPLAAEYEDAPAS